MDTHVSNKAWGMLKYVTWKKKKSEISLDLCWYYLSENIGHDEELAGHRENFSIVLKWLSKKEEKEERKK